MVDFAIPLPHRGERTFIVSDVGHSYLISLLPLLLTMSSYLSIMPIVLAVRRAPAVWGFRLDWSAHPIGNASPYLSEEETVLVGRLKRILSSSRMIKEMTEL
ncbi:hypothetical protein GW17_00015278 [Ensete ventricosum]|nr:hypothetical protein GW17_00015278 [Ensete ventricosum]